MILVYDLKTGNISSIKKALDFLNVKFKISDQVNDLNTSEEPNKDDEIS